MTIYLHIGTPKTGTTTIQVFLEANAERLRERGVIIPTSLGRRNHRRITMYSQDDGVVDNLRKAKGYTSQEQIDKFRTGFLAAFTEEASSWGKDDIIVFTSEQMTKIQSPTAFERLKALCALAGHTVKVVMYVRRQDHYFASEYSQFIKGAKTTTVESELKLAKRPVYDHRKRANWWAAAFGKENVIVRPFETAQFHKKDLIADFMHIIGIDSIDDLERQQTQNEALDVYTLEYLRLMNAHFPRWVGRRSNPRRAALVHALEEISDGPKFRLTAQDARKVLTRFEDGNAEVAREFLGRDDGALFAEAAPSNEGTYPQLTLEKAAEISARLLAKMGRFER